MWKKCDTALIFFHFLHNEVEQVLFVRQECFSLLTSVHSASALERNTSSNSHRASGCTGLVLPCPLSPFLALVTLVLCRTECSCLMPVAFVLDVSLWWVFYRGGNRRQQRVKSWTRSKAETWMETLPRYQLLRYLFLHEKFFWFLNLFSRRDRTNELSFVPSDPSKWI